MDGGSPLVGMVTRAGSACRWRPMYRRRRSTMHGSEVLRIRRAPFTPCHAYVPPVLMATILMTTILMATINSTITWGHTGLHHAVEAIHVCSLMCEKPPLLS